MRRLVMTAVWVAVCAAIPLAAQVSSTLQGPPPPSSGKAPGHPVPPGAPPPAQAVFDATDLGSPVELSKGWRIGVSSDLAAASPGFDDSKWAVRDAQADLPDIADEDDTSGSPSNLAGNEPSAKDVRTAVNQRRFAWFRLHVQLAPSHGPVVLLMELPVSSTTTITLGDPSPSPDVFANGQRIIPEGPNGKNANRYQKISRIYDLSVPPGETQLTLAVRIFYIPFGLGSYTGFFGDHTLILGAPQDLHQRLDLWSNRNLFENMPRIIYSVLLVVLAIFLFALYFAQEGHSEYLWLALHELVQAPLGFVEFAGSTARLDSLWYAALVLQLIVTSAYLFFEFLVAFLALPKRWYIKALRYSVPSLAGVGPVLLFFGHRSLPLIALMALVFALTAFWMIGYCVFVFLTLFAAARKRNFEAALLLVPLILSAVGLFEPIVTAIISQESGSAYSSPLTLNAGPIPIHFASIADYAGILVIVLIIFFRFLRIQHDQERATSELAAARGVQELLIPLEKPATPGFEVDSVYSPANEVGGDFFHVQSMDGGTLVVIGDVAGKGLKAAMNVSTIMGALRSSRERRPARLLESLNRVLSGAESFTTCQAVWFAATGEAVIANAGHLSPYLNSQEIALPGGLPLGVLAEIHYEEARLYLHPGDRLLLMSDGVVEARQPSGELFGFERVHHFSQQSAYYIADAAKACGQQDDITVLTVRRLERAAAA